MPRSTKAEIRASLERIEAIVQDHPQGLQRAEIRDALKARYYEDVADRTLRRRLEQLEEEGRLVRKGKSRAIRYRGAESGAVAPSLTGEGTGNEPRTDQQDAREFLEAYVPGQTWYLPEEIRADLMATGETPNPERPAGTYARDILDRLLIDLSWASSRLEGNTYSRLDTQNLLEYGVHAEGKSQQEAQMILNHRAAIRMLVDNVEEINFDRRTLLGLHAALAENLVASTGEEGALRQRPVEISHTVYRPSGVPQIIQECFNLLLAKVRDIPDPFEQAFFLMVHIPYLQPFIDVNKRTSRIAANIPFIKGNFCPLSFVDVPHETYIEATIGIDERKEVALLRDLFVWAYRRSCAQYRVVREALGEPDTVRFRYRDQLADLVRETVRSRAPIQRSRFRAWAHDHGIEDERQEAFAERAMDILLNLTEGVAGRYGLSDEDVGAWRASLPAGEAAFRAE
jgi:hypothetical protein